MMSNPSARATPTVANATAAKSTSLPLIPIRPLGCRSALRPVIGRHAAGKIPGPGNMPVAESTLPGHMNTMPHIHAVAVFCGSRTGDDPAYHEAAQALGRGLAEQRIRLVYGGGRIGLMGVLADAALAAGGEVVGVIPEFLTRREVAHPDITEMITTDSMHS